MVIRGNGHVVAHGQPQLIRATLHAWIVITQVGPAAELDALRFDGRHFGRILAWVELGQIELRDPHAHVLDETAPLEEADPPRHVRASPFVDGDGIELLDFAQHEVVQMAADTAAVELRVDGDIELEFGRVVDLRVLLVVGKADDAAVAFSHPAREPARLDPLGIVELELLRVHFELGEVGVVQARDVRVVVGRERPNGKFY